MFVYRPSRLRALHTYLKRYLRRNKISTPYLSGDAFANLAHFKVENSSALRDAHQYRSIMDAEILFCRSDLLEELLTTFEDRLMCKVLIAGNSDEEFHELPTPLPKYIRKLYLQNNFIYGNPLVVTMPIGLENYRLGVNGNPKFLLRNNRVANPRNEILLGPFSFTHSERKIVFENLSAVKGPWQYISDWVTPRKFNRIAAQFRFVGAVRGNGVDTHRLWEALYRGNIPILKLDQWSRSVADMNLPVILIDEWSPDVLKDVVRNSYSDFNPKDIPVLWMEFWEKEIQEVCGG